MTLSDVRQRLTETGNSEHFLLFWSKPRGIHPGKVGRDLAFCYVQWLEDVYSRLLGPPFRRTPSERPKIPVYMLNPAKLFPAFSGPVMDIDESGPWLLLPDEIEGQEEADTIAGVAREVTRMFNGFERNPRHPSTAAWAWFDAAFAETVADSVRSGERRSQPIRTPFLGSFEARGAEEYGRAFVNRLMDIIGLQGLNKLWMEGARNPGMTPMELLEREALVPLEYVLPRFHQDWYLRHTVLTLNEEESDGHSLEVLPGGSVKRDGALDHGACRWYRLRLRHDLESIDVALQLRSTASRIVGHVGVVDDAGQYQSIRRLDSHGDGSLSTRLSEVGADRHVTLILSNCGTRGVRQTGINHDDRQYYSLLIEAITSAASGA